MRFTLGNRRVSVIDGLADRLGSLSRSLPGYEIMRFLFNLTSYFDLGSCRIGGYRPNLHHLLDAGNMPTWLPASPKAWVKLFLDRGCRVNDTCRIGTCLHMFFRSKIQRPSELNWQDALIHLVASGANAHAVDDWGESISQIAYADSACHEWNSFDLGSYRGDLWDSVLLACGFKIADFREGRVRTARYTPYYTPEDFKRLWEGREDMCPYWDDRTWPTSTYGDHIEDSCIGDRLVLCTCRDEEETRWFHPADTSTNCFNLQDYQSRSKRVS
ncbi:hypothetical protein F4808DRAFT_445886 [Astrocystis sublimbata]|nr:hypothetical protein F4808DRAFT_445886 [Astrocystis sublimbata]